MTTEPNENASVDPCRFGPAGCMDDLCRNAEVGLCGRHRADYIDDQDDGDVITYEPDLDACPRCSELLDVCECPATTVMFREVDRNPAHVRITVWIGRIPGARGNAGTLTLRTDEWDELAGEPRTVGGILLLPVETQP